ncbi:MAG TPA: NADP-dependent phosphogluconate dehydrogenase [Gemmataceae bacterium]|nr:NADP-dependent phosphogluconate dehydrogenase [Gemmataceae bacterium]
MDPQGYDLGMVGLGVMGRNLLLNMADHGYAVAGLDTNPDKVQALKTEGAGKKVDATTSAADFLAMLRRPRAVMLLVPAGRPVDAVIETLLPLLEPGDLIIDAGNSHFKDTDRRAKALADKGVHFFGMGVSGGEAGARSGPSIMPGGPQAAYERVRPILEAVAAQVNGEPCVTYLGPGSAGHYVKMVHNGIEYGLMQLLAECYDLMKRGLGLNNDELHAVFDQWNQGELNSFLIEITAQIFLKVDDKTGNRLVDMVLDVARQKGTGKWTSQDAMDLQVPIPTIDAAVSMRDLSGYEEERKAAAKALTGPSERYLGDRQAFLGRLRGALYAATIMTYAQGMAQLRKASQVYGYNLKLEDVARIWRGGCIIRATLLEDLRTAYQANPDLPNLLLDPNLGQAVATRQDDLRAVVGTAAQLGIPAPGFMASLGYYDGYRSARLPANLTQAQRDYFGAHTYERIDEKGTFHTDWDEE